MSRSKIEREMTREFEKSRGGVELGDAVGGTSGLIQRRINDEKDIVQRGMINRLNGCKIC